MTRAAPHAASPQPDRPAGLLQRLAAGMHATPLLIVTGLLLATSIWIATGLILFKLRNSAVADTERELRNLALVMAEQVDRAIQSVELVQKSVIERGRGIDSRDVWRRLMSGPAMRQVLKEKIIGLPHVEAVTVIDADGKLINFSRDIPLPDIDISGRDFFRALKADPKLETFVGAPVRNLVSGSWTIYVARKATGPDGEFLGLVLGAMPVEYFERFFASIALGEDSAIALARHDGILLARHPAVHDPGRSYAHGGLFTTVMRSSDRGVIRLISVADGKDRIVAGHKTPHYSVVVAVGTTVRAALASWWDQLRYLGGSAILLTLIVAGIVQLELKQSRAQEQLAKARAERIEADKVRAIADAERQQSEILTATITAMADAVLVADRSGRILVANPAAVGLFGDRHDIGSQEWSRSYHRFEADAVTPLPDDRAPLRRALDGEVVDNVEIVIRAVDGARDMHLIANGRPLRHPSGEVRGAVVVCRDVSHAKQIDHQLRQTQKMDAIGQLTGGIAHDFNNILTVITGTIEILAQGVAGEPKLAAIARMIDDAAERGSELTRRLLAFARKQPLQPRETDVNTLIMDAAQLLRPALGEQIEIESILADDAWPALVDPSQLTTALLNLAVNARDAMPDGGKLTLETRNATIEDGFADSQGELKPGFYVVVTISDTGAGIAPAIRDKVFEPFFTTKGLGKGTGMGLSMVYGFVKQSGGHIKIYSEEGHGTTIKVYLPRAAGPAVAGPEPAAARMITGGTESILVVEDDPMVRSYVTTQLTTLGYTTYPAANGLEALALLDAGVAPDLLFTDVIMPGLNGRELADEARRRRPGLKVLFTSGYSENAIMHHGRLPPGVLLLGKPYRKIDLARMLREALSAWPAAGDAPADRPISAAAASEAS